MHFLFFPDSDYFERKLAGPNFRKLKYIRNKHLVYDKNVRVICQTFFFSVMIVHFSKVRTPVSLAQN